MNTPNTLTARLISAAAAVCTTLVLFSAVVSIGEPQMSVLMAQQQKLQMQQAVPAGDVQLATAPMPAGASRQ
jgi:Tfp pilus assembly PilM family ATPase